MQYVMNNNFSLGNEMTISLYHKGSVVGNTQSCHDMGTEKTTPD